MEQWGIAVDRSMSFRQSPARDAKFFDIGFSEFQSDPVCADPQALRLARR